MLLKTGFAIFSWSRGYSPMHMSSGRSHALVTAPGNVPGCEWATTGNPTCVHPRPGMPAQLALAHVFRIARQWIARRGVILCSFLVRLFLVSSGASSWMWRSASAMARGARQEKWTSSSQNQGTRKRARRQWGWFTMDCCPLQTNTDLLLFLLFSTTTIDRMLWMNLLVTFFFSRIKTCTGKG